MSTGHSRATAVLGTAVLGTAVLAVTVLACSPGTVRVDPPRPAPPAAAACAKLRAALPGTLDGHRRRATGPAPDLTAAWGDPAITLRCGVGLPAAYRPTSQLYTVNGVDWLPEQLTRGYLFTTVGRVAEVELTVPHRYAPEVNPLADLSLIVARQMPTAPTSVPTEGRSDGPEPRR